MKVKVCGNTDLESTKAVSRLHPDLMGFIFVSDSPRYVGAQPPNELFDTGKVERVGVFVNAAPEAITDRIKTFNLDFVQLHGDEPPAVCREIVKRNPGCRIIKAFGVDQGFDFGALKDYLDIVTLFLFDTKCLSSECEKRGGTGRKFDWSVLSRYTLNVPFLLAGGIGEDEIDEILELPISPNVLYGIDLNSRVEVKPGTKDLAAVERIISKVRACIR